MDTKELVIGNIYEFHHQRKGVFAGQLIDIVQADEGDEHDTVYLTVKYDVRGGTDQVRLAVNPGKDRTRVSNLRPSLLLRITPTEENEWLREQEVKEEKKSSIMDRLFKRSD